MHNCYLLDQTTAELVQAVTPDAIKEQDKSKNENTTVTADNTEKRTEGNY